MNISGLDNKVLIIKDEAKEGFINLLSGKLINVKLITLSEFKKKYFFDYDNKTIYYICKKYKVIPEIAKIYINNLYYISKLIDDDKVKFLYDLKNELYKNDLLYENELFREFIKNSEIILYDLEDIDEFYLNAFKELNVNYINLEGEIIKKDIYSFSTLEEEISFVASSICKLIKSGININKIKLCNIIEGYIFDISKIFKLFNIPIEINDGKSAKSIGIVKKFKELYCSNIEETIDKLNDCVFTESDEYYYKKIVNIVNSYNFCDDYEEVKDFIFNEIDKIKVKTNDLLNAVEVIDFKNSFIPDDEYVFMLGFNEGVIPTDFKDEDYLSDEIRTKLNISTSFDLNEKERYYLKKKISLVKNLIVTYSRKDNKTTLYRSSLYDEEIFNEKEYETGFNDSNAFNKIILLKEKDLNNKYNVLSNNLYRLNSHYKDEDYLSYDNKFKGIDSKKMYDYIGNKLTLSYSSMNTYYECAFKYYLDNIIKVNKFEDTFEMTLGNIFHHILSRCFVDNFDLHKAWEEEVENSKYPFNEVDKYFLKGLYNELELTVDVINNQMKYCSLNYSLYEKRITIPINPHLNVNFIGFVDKIIYGEEDGNVIAVIIDYKTGIQKFNINNIKYGLDMQLPVYAYLIKKSNIFDKVIIGGFYLQHILDNKVDINERKESLKLLGYSNSDPDILKYFDSNYVNSQVIKGLRVNNDGSFYAKSKVISNSEIDEVTDTVHDKIINASENILKAKFDINPKDLGNETTCRYCKYRSICYMKNEDIISLGGDNSELD